MKTILYQPLFINPQAYFVFPQLYHIEKGDSYIEPANITGQLIINDLTKVLTSTPTLNVVQDTNQVDFGLFKGKHIEMKKELKKIFLLKMMDIILYLNAIKMVHKVQVQLLCFLLTMIMIQKL